jgi:hypothetical protein
MKITMLFGFVDLMFIVDDGRFESSWYFEFNNEDEFVDDEQFSIKITDRFRRNRL